MADEAVLRIILEDAGIRQPASSGQQPGAQPGSHPASAGGSVPPLPPAPSPPPAGSSGTSQPSPGQTSRSTQPPPPPQQTISPADIRALDHYRDIRQAVNAARRDADEFNRTVDSLQGKLLKMRTGVSAHDISNIFLKGAASARDLVTELAKIDQLLERGQISQAERLQLVKGTIAGMSSGAVAPPPTQVTSATGHDPEWIKRLVDATAQVNRHILIEGQSGSGKSLLTRHIAFQRIDQGEEVHIVDPGHGSANWKGAASVFGAKTAGTDAAKFLKDILDERKQQKEELEAQTPGKTVTQADFKPMTLVFSDFKALMQESPKLAIVFSQMLQEARKFNIGVIAEAATMSGIKDINAIRTNVAQSVSLRATTDAAGKTLRQATIGGATYATPVLPDYADRTDPSIIRKPLPPEPPPPPPMFDPMEGAERRREAERRRALVDVAYKERYGDDLKETAFDKILEVANRFRGTIGGFGGVLIGATLDIMSAFRRAQVEVQEKRREAQLVREAHDPARVANKSQAAPVTTVEAAPKVVPTYAVGTVASAGGHALVHPGERVEDMTGGKRDVGTAPVLANLAAHSVVLPRDLAEATRRVPPHLEPMAIAAATEELRRRKGGRGDTGKRRYADGTADTGDAKKATVDPGERVLHISVPVGSSEDESEDLRSEYLSYTPFKNRTPAQEEITSALESSDFDDPTTKFIIQDEDGKIKAAIAAKDYGDYVGIDHVGSEVAGGGSHLVKEIIKKAKKDGKKGIFIQMIRSGSESFWNKLGLKQGNNNFPLPIRYASGTTDTGDAQRAVVDPGERIANFDKWFGESKAVTDTGEPLRLFHGTPKDFDRFNVTSDIGFHFGTAEAANKRLDNLTFAEEDRIGHNVKPVYLSITNPITTPDLFEESPDNFYDFLHRNYPEVLSDNTKSIADQFLANQTDFANDIVEDKYPNEFLWKPIRDDLKAAGYDGIRYRNEVEGNDESWVAFDSEQIKSAIFNKGTFDPNNTDIRYASGTTDTGDAQRATVDPGERVVSDLRRRYKNFDSKNQVNTGGTADVSPHLGSDDAGIAALRAFTLAAYPEINAFPDHPASKALTELTDQLPDSKSKNLTRVLGFKSWAERSQFLRQIGVGTRSKPVYTQDKTFASWNDAKYGTGIGDDLASQHGPYKVTLNLSNPIGAKDIGEIYSDTRGWEVVTRLGDKYRVINDKLDSGNYIVNLESIAKDTTVPRHANGTADTGDAQQAVVDPGERVVASRPDRWEGFVPRKAPTTRLTPYSMEQVISSSVQDLSEQTGIPLERLAGVKVKPREAFDEIVENANAYFKPVDKEVVIPDNAPRHNIRRLVSHEFTHALDLAVGGGEDYSSRQASTPARSLAMTEKDRLKNSPEKDEWPKKYRDYRNQAPELVAWATERHLMGDEPTMDVAPFQDDIDLWKEVEAEVEAFLKSGKELIESNDPSVSLPSKNKLGIYAGRKTRIDNKNDPLPIPALASAPPPVSPADILRQHVDRFTRDTGIPFDRIATVNATSDLGRTSYPGAEGAFDHATRTAKIRADRATADNSDLPRLLGHELGHALDLAVGGGQFTSWRGDAAAKNLVDAERQRLLESEEIAHTDAGYQKYRNQPHELMAEAIGRHLSGKGVTRESSAYMDYARKVLGGKQMASAAAPGGSVPTVPTERTITGKELVPVSIDRVASDVVFKVTSEGGATDTGEVIPGATTTKGDKREISDGEEEPSLLEKLHGAATDPYKTLFKMWRKNKPSKSEVPVGDTEAMASAPAMPTARAEFTTDTDLPPVESVGGIAAAAEETTMLATAATAAVAGIAVLGKAAITTGQMMSQTASHLSQYNAQLASATALAEVRQIVNDIRRANDAAPTLSRFVNSASELQQSTENLKIEFIKMIGPVITGLADTAAMAVNLLTGLMKIGNAILEFLANLPVLSQIGWLLGKIWELLKTVFRWVGGSIEPAATDDPIRAMMASL